MSEPVLGDRVLHELKPKSTQAMNQPEGAQVFSFASFKEDHIVAVLQLAYLHEK